jgi:hypothetical protein
VIFARRRAKRQSIERKKTKETKGKLERRESGLECGRDATAFLTICVNPKQSNGDTRRLYNQTLRLFPTWETKRAALKNRENS